MEPPAFHEQCKRFRSAGMVQAGDVRLGPFSSHREIEGEANPLASAERGKTFYEFRQRFGFGYWEK